MSCYDISYSFINRDVTKLINVKNGHQIAYNHALVGNITQFMEPQSALAFFKTNRQNSNLITKYKYPKALDIMKIAEIIIGTIVTKRRPIIKSCEITNDQEFMFFFLALLGSHGFDITDDLDLYKEEDTQLNKLIYALDISFFNKLENIYFASSYSYLEPYYQFQSKILSIWRRPTYKWGGLTHIINDIYYYRMFGILMGNNPKNIIFSPLNFLSGYSELRNYRQSPITCTSLTELIIGYSNFLENCTFPNLKKLVILHYCTIEHLNNVPSVTDLTVYELVIGTTKLINMDLKRLVLSSSHYDNDEKDISELILHFKNLEDLEYGLSSPIDLSSLSKLKKVTFGNFYNNAIDEKLPESLEELAIGNDVSRCNYDKPIIILPKSLKALQICCKNVYIVRYPPYLETLKIYKKYDLAHINDRAYFNFDILPKTLQHMDINIDYVRISVLPQNLKTFHLKCIACKFKCQLPLTITDLSVYTKYLYQLNKFCGKIGKLPPNLTKVNFSYDKDVTYSHFHIDNHDKPLVKLQMLITRPSSYDITIEDKLMKYIRMRQNNGAIVSTKNKYYIFGSGTDKTIDDKKKKLKEHMIEIDEARET